MVYRPQRFVTLFPSYRDFHFFKDPGQIPYRLSKIGYDARIICYKNETDYPQTEKHIPLQTIKKNRLTRRFNVSLFIFLLFNSRKIDILNVYHIKWESLMLSFWYKIFNPRGFVYLKMDNCHYCGTYSWENIFNSNQLPQTSKGPIAGQKMRIKNFIIRRLFVKKVNLWSVEDESSRLYYTKHYPFFKNNLITVYNGQTIEFTKVTNVNTFREKENIILTVGNIGTFSKATDILLESFKKIANKCDWELHLAGKIAADFEKHIENIFKENPEFKERIIFHGSLEKETLYALYNRAKIFCLPSRFEGFANVYPEAMFFRNAIITTPYVSVKDLIINNEMGLIVEKDNPIELAEAIMKLIDNPDLMSKYADNAHSFAKEKLGWDRICIDLKNSLEKHRNKPQLHF